MSGLLVDHIPRVLRTSRRHRIYGTRWVDKAAPALTEPSKVGDGGVPDFPLAASVKSDDQCKKYYETD